MCIESDIDIPDLIEILNTMDLVLAKSRKLAVIGMHMVLLGSGVMLSLQSWQVDKPSLKPLELSQGEQLVQHWLSATGVGWFPPSQRSLQIDFGMSPVDHLMSDVKFKDSS